MEGDAQRPGAEAPPAASAKMRGRAPLLVSVIAAAVVVALALGLVLGGSAPGIEPWQPQVGEFMTYSMARNGTLTLNVTLTVKSIQGDWLIVNETIESAGMNYSFEGPQPRNQSFNPFFNSDSLLPGTVVRTIGNETIDTPWGHRLAQHIRVTIPDLIGNGYTQTEDLWLRADVTLKVIALAGGEIVEITLVDTNIHQIVNG